MGSFFSSLFSWFNSSSASFVIIGQDNAGKTTLYGLLMDHQLTSACPTVHPNSGSCVVRTDKVNLIDLGGSDIQRRAWKTYLQYDPMKGVVYMIDIADLDRYHSARQLFVETMRDVDDAPVLVLLNKTDIPHAMNYQQVMQQLQADISTIVKPNQVRFAPCSLVRMEGYMEGMEWLLRKLKERS